MEVKVKLKSYHSCFILIFVCLTATLKADVGFENWKQSFRQVALKEGVLAITFDRAMQKVTPDPQVIELDSSQPEFTRSVWDYLNNATSKARISKGKALMQQHRVLFDQIEKHYGVQREIITAIWAMESDFGRNYGNKNVLQSLATLAYASGSEKRAKFASDELLLTLKIIQSNKIQSNELIGSWAGAMGQPQFMPSSYLDYAVDYNRDGKIDLWQNLPDIFASIANFLVESGWRKTEHWGVEVRLPKIFDWRLNSASYQLRYEQWQQLGVKRISGKPYAFPQRQAALFIPAGKNGPVFLVSHNFSVIKHYNQSSSYALAVANLSNLLGLGAKIKGTWPVIDEPLSMLEVREIQSLLNKQGHSVGSVDGKIGSKTREAIRTWQLEKGLAGDGYANLALLKQLRLVTK